MLTRIAGYGNPSEITAVAHDPSGLYFAAGTAGGLVALYDVRSSRPLYIMEHKHGMPIHTIKFHPGSGTVLSSDEKLVKIWRYKSSGDIVETRAREDRSDQHKWKCWFRCSKCGGNWQVCQLYPGGRRVGSLRESEWLAPVCD